MEHNKKNLMLQEFNINIHSVHLPTKVTSYIFYMRLDSLLYRRSSQFLL